MSSSLSFCSYFNQGVCHSCSCIEQDYSSQLSEKEQKARQALNFFPSVQLEKSIGSPTQMFRNRAKMAVTGSIEQPLIGLVGQVHLDAGREILACPIHHPKINELLAAMPEMIQNYGLFPYQIHERKGELKGLIAFYSPMSDQMYLRFILRSKECIGRIRKLLPGLQNRFPALTCVSANIQPIPHAILEGTEEIILSHRDSIDHQIGPITLKLSPQAFVQTNVQVATQLYQTAADWIYESKADRVLDLFCGQGAFSFFAAQNAKEFLGIEINLEAVKAANATAQRLGWTHLRFKNSDASEVKTEIQEFRPDLILANPPRKGLAKSLSLIQSYRPSHFLYSSCCIETLANDLRELSNDYHPKKVKIFDLFPHTHHFESLVWLERKFTE